MPYGHNTLDLVFLFHTSSKIDRSGWEAYKRFLIDVIYGANIDGGDVRVGAVFYHSSGDAHFSLMQHKTLAELVWYINSLPLEHARDANIAAGMDAVREKMFTAAGGDRPNVPNAVIVVTDSDSTMDVDKIATSAQRLRQESGARIYTAGIGLRGSTQFSSIASAGSTMYWADSAGGLSTVQQGLVSQIPPRKRIGMRTQSLMILHAYILNRGTYIILQKLKIV